LVFDNYFGFKSSGKGKEEHFRIILKEYEPEEVVYVGDSITDMQIAKKYGVHAIGIIGTFSESELFLARADFVLKNLKELLSLLKT